MAELGIRQMLGSLVVSVVGVALVPVLYSIITAANITDATTAALISLIPLFFVVGILYATLKPLL